MTAPVKVIYARRVHELTPDPSMPAGREGTVYRDPTDANRAVKVLHAPDDAWRGKVRVMRRNPISSRDFAWPFGLVFCPRTKSLIGCLIPFVARKQPISRLYENDPANSLMYSNYANRVCVAQNLATVFDRIHQHGCIVGDVSPSNLLVGRDGNVTAIDVDSMQITRDGKTHRCCVGTGDYTPAELHGKRFSDVDRSWEHDAFGLACLIFQLLTANHPFSGSYRGNGNEIPLLQRIELGIWPYSGRHPDYVPRTAAPFDLLHSLLQPLMRQCFEDGHTTPTRRPTPADWMNALAEVRRDRDFVQRIAPRLEADAQAKHASQVAQKLRSVFPVHATPARRSRAMHWLHCTRSGASQLRSIARNHPRIVAFVAATTASLLLVCAGMWGMHKWTLYRMYELPVSSKRPRPAPNRYLHAREMLPVPTAVRETRPEPELYRRVADKYR